MTEDIEEAENRIVMLKNKEELSIDDKQDMILTLTKLVNHYDTELGIVRGRLATYQTRLNYYLKTYR